jgi:hypothetical protein
VALAREKQLEEEAGLRIRSKYQALEAQKQERRLVFTAANVPPMKRARTNGCELILQISSFLGIWVTRDIIL